VLVALVEVRLAAVQQMVALALPHQLMEQQPPEPAVVRIILTTVLELAQQLLVRLLAAMGLQTPVLVLALITALPAVIQTEGPDLSS
jgi:hypothetical protein